MIPLLAPLFTGDLAPHAETLQCAPSTPPEAVPVSRLVHDPAVLRDALLRHAAHLGADPRDLRPVASVWALDYLWALLPPVVAAASVLQHVFPVAAVDVAVTLDEDGEARCFHIRHLGAPMPGVPAERRYDALVMHHLAPLFAAVTASTGLPGKVLWANAARHLGFILDQAIALTDLAPVRADRARLLDDPAGADGARNPLHAPRRCAGAIVLHAECCLAYRLPAENHCDACPLDPAHRASRTAAATSP